MRDIARFGLPIAVLVAAAATCAFLLFAPTVHAPGIDRMTGHVQVHQVVTVPHESAPAEEATTRA